MKSMKKSTMTDAQARVHQPGDDDDDDQHVDFTHLAAASSDDESSSCGNKQKNQHDSSIDDTTSLTVEGTSSSDDSLDRSSEDEHEEVLRHRPRLFESAIVDGLANNTATISDSSSMDECSRHSRRDSVVDGKFHGLVGRRAQKHRSIFALLLVIMILWVTALLCSTSFRMHPWNSSSIQDETLTVLPPVHHGPRYVDADWSQFLTTKAPQIRQAIRNHHRRLERTFTILLTGSRLDLIQQSIDAHAQCYMVEQIQVDWKSELRLPRRVFRQPKVVVASNNSDGGEIISTDGVLVLDEDVVISCADLERAFGIWRKNRDRMVGFYPFVHDGDNFSMKAVRRNSGGYSLVSSRAAFVHKLYVESFSSTSSRRNDEACNPLALSVHCTAISSKPPMVVAGRPRELRAVNLYQSQYASEDKSSCLRQWVEGHGMDDLPWEGATFVGM